MVSRVQAIVIPAHATQKTRRKRMRSDLIKDLDAMENVMLRTADRSDIWQDRCVYAMAKAISHILQWIIRKEQHEKGHH
jgi:hypothetical protein